MKRITIFVKLLIASVKKWNRDKCSRLSAALAFYSGLALAPLLILLVVFIGMWLSTSEAQELIIQESTNLVGEDGAVIVQEILSEGFDPRAGAVASAVSILAIIYSASSLFAQLEDAFDTIWQAGDHSSNGIISYIIKRLRALLILLAVGVILLLTVVFSVFISTLKDFVEASPEFFISVFPFLNPTTLSEIIDWVLVFFDWSVSLFVLTMMFAFLFNRLPSIDLTFKDVRAGAFLAAVMFFVGRNGLAWYLSRGTIGSAYGAAGSLLVLLIWVYYSAQMMLLGAEYTVIDATTYGSLSDRSVET